MNKEKINEEIKKCEEEKIEYLEGWKRAKADLINYKNEEEKRSIELINYVQKEFILEILLILDNLEMAETTMPPENEWVQGFLNIKKQMLSFLEKKGVKPIKTIGEVFNPNFHEAVDIKEVPEKNSGTIIEEVQKGYFLGDKVIRPAKVKVIK